MAKKTQEIQLIKAKLVKSKEEFKQQLEQRIAKGRELLAITVLAQKSNDYYGRGRIVYDETAKDNFFEQYKKWTNYNVELLNASFDTANSQYTTEYQNAGRSFIFTSNTDIIKEQQDEIKSKITTLESFIERLDLISCIESTNSIANLKTEKHSMQTNKVFVVHGHNETVKLRVARTLEKLGLEPIILNEQDNSGKTIIEKFEKNSSNVDFAVILLTADDEGKSNEEEKYKSRARQNVVFEMGYFTGKLGRNRVLLLLENGVEKPSDLDGIVYTPIDENDGWKLKLVKELKAAHFTVSADNL
ncbi:MAG: nucleotide-binding protein [Dysgonamonadaceae bacterium]|jgi:predicted nucleotide-binding protein|nr:nucleotide-binding protein [Dysgonamonadaceae bacterium]